MSALPACIAQPAAHKLTWRVKGQVFVKLGLTWGKNMVLSLIGGLG